jgi:hypothetical protein
MTKATLSLADLNARAASNKGYEFEYLLGGEPTGFFITVLGANADAVAATINAEVNAMRRREQFAAARRAKARQSDVPEFEPIEEDIASGQRLAAVRICGWRGVTEPYSPEAALALCQSNPDVCVQVIAASSALENFLKPSPTT